MSLNIRLTMALFLIAAAEVGTIPSREVYANGISMGNIKEE
jgi:hypothetical protein